MCDPMTIAGLALSAAGGYGQAQTQANYVDEVNRQNQIAARQSAQARLAERQRQREWEQQSTQAFTDTLNDSGRGDMQAGADEAAAKFVETVEAQPAVLDENTTLAGQDQASDAVKASIAKSASEAAAQSKARLQALARVQSYGSTMQDRALGRAQTGDFLSILGGLRRGSLGVAQQEQDVPSALVTPGSSTFADLLSGAGSIMSMAGPLGTNPLSGFGSLFGGGGASAAAGLAPVTSLRPMARPVGLV